MRTTLQVTLAAWAVVEVALRIHSARQGGRSDREWSMYVIFAAVVLGNLAAGLAAGSHLAPIGGRWPAATGLGLVWFGVAFRLWAILTLGRFFKFAVAIQTEHQVVDRGPYRWLRHPSYTGALIALAGVGLATGDWVSTTALVVIPLAAFLVRIQVEERALLRALGDRYAGYAGRTRRLLPGLW